MTAYRYVKYCDHCRRPTSHSSKNVCVQCGGGARTPTEDLRRKWRRMAELENALAERDEARAALAQARRDSERLAWRAELWAEDAKAKECQLDEARKDTEKLDWLRDHWNSTEGITVLNRIGEGADPRTAINQARAKERIYVAVARMKEKH